jgi:ParB-like chromosome segregation protein Spo0J
MGQQPTHSTVIVDTRLTLLDQLRPHPDNPNNGDTDAIAESLQTNGLYRPIVARTDGTVLAGHHVYAAALELGWTELLVTFVDVDDEAARRILIADNRIAELGPGVDIGLLMPLLDDLATTTAGLTGVGYTEMDLDNLRSLLDHGAWDADDQEYGDGAAGSPESFWPKIQLQVSPDTFDAWRKLLDQYPGGDDVAKLTAHLQDQDVL